MSEPTKEQKRAAVRALAYRSIEAGDATGWYETLYAGAAGDPSSIPWAELTPAPQLLAWLEALGTPPPGTRALDVGCGLGDNAEAMAAAGHAVTAFDISPSAVAWCRRRFPRSSVDYRVADLFALPEDFARAFDLVHEMFTLQTIPHARRAEAIAAIAGTVAPGGKLLVYCRGRDPHEPEGELPWHLSLEELSGLGRAGLERLSFEDAPDEDGVRRFRLVYRRP